ncbi:hypothetical protein F5050DRAFT_1804088 [Lentinula boryana]|uniref:Uncharacterized protein n=1 Tax=Lentinula boryana TaxID=40481 RepID=A0ABQ8QPX9_9AGAR|nr:hypothetical protein F5050DRAFT_1804088 [Lentinula boryana]
MELSDEGFIVQSLESRYPETYLSTNSWDLYSDLLDVLHNDIVTASDDFTLAVHWTTQAQLGGCGKFLFSTGSRDKYVKLIEDLNAKDNSYHLLDLTGHTDSLRSLFAYGRPAVSGLYDKTVRIETGIVVKDLLEGITGIWKVAFMGNGASVRT